jgi:WhiB family redox-sensing transcriptional regulator
MEVPIGGLGDLEELAEGEIYSSERRHNWQERTTRDWPGPHVSSNANRSRTGKPTVGFPEPLELTGEKRGRPIELWGPNGILSNSTKEHTEDVSEARQYALDRHRAQVKGQLNELPDPINLTPLRRDWVIFGNCTGVDPELFYPGRGASTKEAKQVCQGCAVRKECLEFALANGEKFGIWGGLSERERRRIRRQRNQTIAAIQSPTF